VIFNVLYRSHWMLSVVVVTDDLRKMNLTFRDFLGFILPKQPKMPSQRDSDSQPHYRR